MLTLLLVIIFSLGIVALARIIWVAMAVGFAVLWAIPAFLILFIGFGLISPWFPILIAITFILMFNGKTKRNCPWM